MEDIRGRKTEQHDEPQHEAAGPTFIMKVKRWFRIGWLFTLYVFDIVADKTADNWVIAKREGDLLFGTALALIGVFGFNSGKFCDGNTADYLSCTRPTAYHYYSAFDIALIVIGVFFIQLWFFKR